MSANKVTEKVAGKFFIARRYPMAQCTVRRLCLCPTIRLSQEIVSKRLNAERIKLVFLAAVAELCHNHGSDKSLQY